MQKNSIQKILKALNPLSCQQTRQRFDAFSRNELEAEQDEGMREHLLVCDKCLNAFTDTVGQKVDSGELPLRDWPSHLPLPPMELFAPSPAHTEHEVLGIIWQKVWGFAAAQGQKWAEPKLTQTKEYVERFMEFCEGLTGIREPAFATLGATVVPTMGVQVITAEVLDNNWKPTGTTVRFEIGDKESPRITADGSFTLTARTADRQWVGTQVFCTLTLVENQKVSFESVVEPDRSGQSGLVKIEAEGLPRKATMIPISFVRISLLSPGK